MEREDGRKLSVDIQEDRRKTIVRLRKQGRKLREIEQTVSLSRTTICKTLKTYRESGWKALRGKQRGTKKGERRTLSAKQEAHIRSKIIDKRPEQLKLDFALWTRDAVRQLIQQELNIAMPIRTVGEYLKRWGFTPQKPVKFAYERRPEKVREWLDVTFPGMRERARKEKAEIYWGDETGLRGGDVRGRGFAPRGQTPVVKATAKYENLSMVSAITNKGKVSWMIVEGTINAERFIEFTTGLCKDSRKKIFLVLDNLKVHHSKPVKNWLVGKEKKIELFFLPAYSPDLNPDEHVNADLKQGVGAKVPVRTKEALHKAAHSHMEMLKSNPSRIQKYFKDPAISYAAVNY